MALAATHREAERRPYRSTGTGVGLYLGDQSIPVQRWDLETVPAADFGRAVAAMMNAAYWLGREDERAALEATGEERIEDAARALGSF